jgi:small-conductance mechanosensitive channel
LGFRSIPKEPVLAGNKQRRNSARYTVKLAEYRQTFYEFSGKASDVSRQLAFAAIAIIWLFKNDLPGGGQLTIPRALIFPGILIVTALAADLLQYVLASLIWRLYYRYLEKKHVRPEADIQHSPWLEIPITALFWIKVVLVILGYIFILIFLLRAFGLIMA